MTLGEKIRAARLEQKLTQEQLGGRDFTKSLTQWRSPPSHSGERKTVFFTGLHIGVDYKESRPWISTDLFGCTSERTKPNLDKTLQSFRDIGTLRAAVGTAARGILPNGK